MTPVPRSRRPRGVALVTVLWVMALLVVVAATVTANSRTDVEMARNLVDAAKARLAAESAVRLVILDLLIGGEEVEDYGAGAVTRREVLGLPVAVAVFDEAGRIDLNAAPRSLLEGLVAAAGVDPGRETAVVDAILDWRDPDHLRRPAGAEDRDYEAAGRGYGARDAPFGSLEELRLVLGVDREVFERVVPALTLHSGRAGVSLKVASPLVARAVEGGIERSGTGGPVPLTSTERLQAAWAAASRAGTFTIYARGQGPGGAKAAVAATVTLGAAGGAPYTIVDWREEPVAAERLFARDAAQGGEG